MGSYPDTDIDLFSFRPRSSKIILLKTFKIPHKCNKMLRIAALISSSFRPRSSKIILLKTFKIPHKCNKMLRIAALISSSFRPRSSKIIFKKTFKVPYKCNKIFGLLLWYGLLSGQGHLNGKYLSIKYNVSKTTYDSNKKKY